MKGLIFFWNFESEVCLALERLSTWIIVTYFSCFGFVFSIGQNWNHGRSNSITNVTEHASVCRAKLIWHQTRCCFTISSVVRDAYFFIHVISYETGVVNTTQLHSQHSLLMSAGDYLALIILFFSLFFPFGNYNSLTCGLNSLKQNLDISHYLYLLWARVLNCLPVLFHVHLKLNVYNTVQYFSGQNICYVLKGQVWKNASHAFVIVHM